jgi:hypothetical protein
VTLRQGYDEQLLGIPAIGITSEGDVG